MSFKLENLDSKLRERIEKQIREEDAAKVRITPAVGAVEADRAEPVPVRALERGLQKQPRGKAALVGRVCVVAFRQRLLDPDAVSYSFKGLTDAIAASLGIDDADPRIEWSWHQIQHRTEGCSVLIEKLA